MANVLVTGGAGFVGSHLVERLLERGHLVKVLDDFSGSSLSNIRHLFGNRRFKLVRGDVRDYQLVRDVTRDIDVVYHLAAQIHVERSILEPQLTNEVNVGGTLNVLNAALENDVERVIYASSSEVYGSAQSARMDEEHPLCPASPYGASKLAGDRYCLAYHKTYGIDVTMVRNFNIYGPRQKSTGYGGAIAIFMGRVLSGLPPVIYGDGKQTRDYMYIDDAVRAYELVAESRRLAGEAINFGTGEEISILELAGKIIALAGMGRKLRPVHVAPRPGEVRRLRADISKARRMGFVPKLGIDMGLRKYFEWFRGFRHEEWTKLG